MNEGEGAATIDEIPLDWCLQDGVKLDFCHFDDGYVVTATDVEEELKRINYELKPLDIVVINTAAGKRYGFDDYVSAGCGMGLDATLYLLERGVRVTGTDGWSWDAPFVHTKEKYEETGDASLIWEGHKAGKQIDIAISRNSTTLKCCRLVDLPFPAFHTRSVAPLQVGPERWQFWTTIEQ